MTGVLRFVLLFYSVSCALAQEDRENAISSIFQVPSGRNLTDIYDDVTRNRSSDSFGALARCGEGSDEGVHICVPYHRCDATTKTVVEEVNNAVEEDGYGVIDIRNGGNTCRQYLDVCCALAQGTGEVVKPDTSGDFLEPPTSSTTTTRPSTRRISDKCGVRRPNGLDFTLTSALRGESNYGEFPWMVALIDKAQKSTTAFAFCGGSLITNRVVLTAGHCVQSYRSHPNTIKIRAGEWDAQSDKERLPYQERDVSSIILHNKYKQGVLHNDIALLVLSSPVQFDEHINTICLPDQGEVVESSRCFANGWGKDVFGDYGQYQMILKKVEVPTVPHNSCQSILRTTKLRQRFILHDSFMCAGGNEEDTCTGDGGGPLVCPSPKDRSRYVQVGIVSWGIGCGNRVPGVYTDVSKFRDWVDSQLNTLEFENSGYVV